MSLKGRLTRLEPALTELWRRDWEAFWAVAKRHWGPVFDSWDAAGWAREAFELDISLGELEAHLPELPGLDLPAWCAWFRSSGPADIDGEPDFQYWPKHHALPPDEAIGAWEELTKLLSEPGRVGQCAALTLLMLASGRATRQFCGSLRRE